MRITPRVFLAASLGFLPLWGCTGTASSPQRLGTPLVPRLASEPWTIAGDPDLGEFTAEVQQPVDFGVWQAADGTWQAWSCIRRTKCGGNTRLFHRWEGQRITDPDWKPMGIAMQADPQYGETPGGLQAPYVFRNGSEYVMVYGDWVNICLARSKDGKTFERWLTDDGKAGRFSEGKAGANTRDPMILQVADQWYCYYTATPEWRGYDFCRVSDNLTDWSESWIVSYGGRSGRRGNSTECPFVAFRQGYYYLFRTEHYGQNAATHVYRSQDPLRFNLGDDAGYVCTLPVAAPEIILHEGEEYMAYLLPSLKGLQIARLAWDPAPVDSDPGRSRPGPP